MRPRTLLLFLAAALVATFVALNWSAFVAPTTLSLGFRTVVAPLGLIMVGLTVVVALALMGYANYVRKAALVKVGQNAEELRIQRRLADDAEASRFTDLRNYLESELRHLSDEGIRHHTELRARIEALENEWHDSHPQHPEPLVEEETPLARSG